MEVGWLGQPAIQIVQHHDTVSRFVFVAPGFSQKSADRRAQRYPVVSGSRDLSHVDNGGRSDLTKCQGQSGFARPGGSDNEYVVGPTVSVTEESGRQVEWACKVAREFSCWLEKCR